MAFTPSGQRTIFAPRALNPSGFYNQGFGTRCGYMAAPASPGSLITISGVNLASQSATAQLLPLPLQLDGLSVRVNGSAVPVQSVTNSTITILLPQEVLAGTLSYQIEVDESTTPVETTQVLDVAPLPSYDDLTCQALAFHADTHQPVDRSNPAKPGDLIEIHGTGLGRTVPSVPAGDAAPSDPPAATVFQPEVLIAGRTAHLVSSVLTPGTVGDYTVSVTIPRDLHQTGLASLVWRGSEFESKPLGQTGSIYIHAPDSVSQITTPRR